MPPSPPHPRAVLLPLLQMVETTMMQTIIGQLTMRLSTSAPVGQPLTSGEPYNRRCKCPPPFGPACSGGLSRSKPRFCARQRRALKGTTPPSFEQFKPEAGARGARSTCERFALASQLRARGVTPRSELHLDRHICTKGRNRAGQDVLTVGHRSNGTTLKIRRSDENRVRYPRHSGSRPRRLVRTECAIHVTGVL